MLHYLSGLFKYNLIPNETTLVVRLAEECQQLNFKEIINTYKRYFTCICFSETNYYAELERVLMNFKKENIKTCIISNNLPDMENKKSKFVDYVITGFDTKQQQIFKRDYCPFADTEDWITVE